MAAMSSVIHAFLARIVRRGGLTVETASGKSFHVGDGTGEHLRMRFADRGAPVRLLINPELAFGEVFMAGRIVVPGGTIYDLLVLFMANLSGRTPRGIIKARRLLRHALRPFKQWNPTRSAKGNIAHHYDLDSPLPIERAGLIVTDVEIWRLHYAQTLRAWRERFLARRAEARGVYDERFCFMWEFYLAGAEASFRDDSITVFQIQLAKRQDVVPLTRDYVDAEKRKLLLRAQMAPGGQTRDSR